MQMHLREHCIITKGVVSSAADIFVIYYKQILIIRKGE